MIRFINFENKLFSEASWYIDSILHIVRDISTTSLHSFPIFSGFDLREKTNESGLYLILVTHRKVLRCLRINNTKIKPILLLLLQLWDISDFLSSFLQFSLIEHMLKSSIRFELDSDSIDTQKTIFQILFQFPLMSVLVSNKIEMKLFHWDHLVSKILAYNDVA